MSGFVLGFQDINKTKLGHLGTVLFCQEKYF